LMIIYRSETEISQ